MNSLILLHNKYPKKSPNKKNDTKLTMNFDGTIEKLIDPFENEKEEDKIKINNSSQVKNIPNNTN